MRDKDSATSEVQELSHDSETPSFQHVSSVDSEGARGDVVDASTQPKMSKARGVVMIATLSAISFLNTMGSGILIAALPRIADDVGLDKSLILVSLCQFFQVVLCNMRTVPPSPVTCAQPGN